MQQGQMGAIAQLLIEIQKQTGADLVELQAIFKLLGVIDAVWRTTSPLPRGRTHPRFPRDKDRSEWGRAEMGGSMQKSPKQDKRSRFHLALR